MKIRLSILALIAISSLCFCIGAAADEKPYVKREASMNTLHLYGPGGPAGPMEECAKLFFNKTGTAVKVKTGLPQQWIGEARHTGGFIFEGAEYMLNDFMQTYPGFVDEASITGLYARSAAILVRKGNPKSIKGLGDLTKEGVRIMAVTQENMEEVYGRVPGIHYHIVMPVLTGAKAAGLWKTTPDLDAWITYESWHYALKDQTELIRIPERERVLRITPIALIATTKKPEQAKAFINFMRSDEVHGIFRKWGWK